MEKEDIYISVPAVISKSNPGEMDSDGNYVFEVEASNENVDLQNQRILADALQDSKEYFLSNGVISDDHQHRKRSSDGEVYTDYDKVIGEPISVERRGKRTFVKGKLYGMVEAAKPFINLLKSASSRVKASVGGIMPTIKRNNDGTETITGFMWNDLALTCSPVNSTVAPACFAKSMSVEEFCKALSATPVTFDHAQMKDGQALMDEDLENKKTEIKNTDDDEDEEEKLEKSLIEICEPDEKVKQNIQEEYGKNDEINDLINEVMENIKNGEIKSKDDIVDFLLDNGIELAEANEITNEIESELGKEEGKMMKFTEAINGIFKSLGKKDCEEVVEKGCVKKSEEAEEKDDSADSDDEDINLDDEDEDKDEDKEDVKKSFIDSDMSDDSVELTELFKSIDSRLDANAAEIAAKDAQIEELQKSILKMGEVMEEYLSSPQVKKSIMVEKANRTDSAVPTQGDYEVFKSALCLAKKDGFVDLKKSVHLETVFQNAVKGKPMSAEDEGMVRNIYSKFVKGE